MHRLFVRILDAVLSSIKTRFSKQATEFMERIAAFSLENWDSDGSTAAVRCLAVSYGLDATVAVAQYKLFVSPTDDDCKERAE